MRGIVHALLAGGILSGTCFGTALAQRQIDDPRLSPMLFGETEKERRDKVRQEEDEQQEAERISQEQQRDAEQIDDPKMSPLLFGPGRDDDEEEDLV
ncbi:MAG: hypothetical protein ACX939_15515, partial [Hyphococcus sp.]